MSKLETVDNLNQFLKSLKDITSDLEKDISELRDVLSSKAFISEELNESIRNRLLNISGIQKSFFDEYVTLDIGELPEKTDIAQEALDKFRENIESESKYIEAVNFFMSLHSNDANVQAMLDKRKEYLSSIDISGELSKEVKTALSGYILLFDAYREEDQMKKFPLIFGLAEYFEMEIAREVQFCTFEIIVKTFCPPKVTNGNTWKASRVTWRSFSISRKSVRPCSSIPSYSSAAWATRRISLRRKCIPLRTRATVRLP